MFTLSLRQLAVGALASTLVLAMWAPGVMAAPRPLTVSVLIGDTCVTGTARKNSFVKVVVRDPAGHVILREAGDTGTYGEWQVCGYGYPILAGAKVRATVFETGQSRHFTVPKLTIDTDRVSEVVSGKAPAGSKVTLEVSTSGASVVGLPEYDFFQHVVTAGNGTYSHDFSSDGIDLIGGTAAIATWQSGSGAVKVWRQTYVPGLAVAIGESRFSGVFKPNAHLGMVVSHNSNQVATGDAVADPFYGGQIAGEFVDADTEPYAIQPGDLIEAPGLGSDGTFTVPKVAGTVNLATDRVSGTCFANGMYLVYVVGPQYEVGFDFGVAAPNGSFTADLSYQLNIKKGFSVEIGCYTSNADLVAQIFTAH
ncbi:MAG: hypothetical protein ABI725_09145 [Chloroflexota bacterium]